MFHRTYTRYARNKWPHTFVSHYTSVDHVCAYMIWIDGYLSIRERIRDTMSPTFFHSDVVSWWHRRFPAGSWRPGCWVPTPWSESVPAPRWASSRDQRRGAEGERRSGWAEVPGDSMPPSRNPSPRGTRSLVHKSRRPPPALHPRCSSRYHRHFLLLPLLLLLLLHHCQRHRQHPQPPPAPPRRSCPARTLCRPWRSSLTLPTLRHRCLSLACRPAAGVELSTLDPGARRQDDAAATAVAHLQTTYHW